MVAVGVEEGAGGQQSTELRFGQFFSLILFNSYVNHSINPCMYVDDTKFDLTP